MMDEAFVRISTSDSASLAWAESWNKVAINKNQSTRSFSAYVRYNAILK